VPFERMSSIPATVASPVNPRKRYFEVNTFFADTLGFGTRTAQDASINMYTVQTKSRIQMTLDLKRKEIDIRFPLLIENSKSNLRFRMPFSLLSNIYRVVEEDTDEIALIIPFDNSPQFFVQKTPTDSDDESAFSSNDLRWVDWNTWFRETDIVSGPTRKQMALKPLSNYRESAIIDIGQYCSYEPFIRANICRPMDSLPPLFWQEGFDWAEIQQLLRGPGGLWNHDSRAE
jgi:RNA-dependent RNA polymerase